MLEEIRTWCEGLIVAIVICVIIETLIPESNNKKYIKIVSGIYIMFISFSPILSLLNYDFKNIKNYDFIETEETAVILENDMKDVYLISIELDIKQAIQELGYEINDIRIKTDNNYENIEKIIISKSLMSEEENNEISKMLKEKYLIDEEKIIFK